MAECMSDGTFDYGNNGLVCVPDKLSEGEECTKNSDCEKNKCVVKNDQFMECWEVCPKEPAYECSHIPKWGDCTEADVCAEDDQKCYREDASRAQCRPSCPKDWECHAEEPAGKWSDCTVSKECKHSDFDCFEKDETYSECRQKCDKKDWDCYEETETALWGDCTISKQCVEPVECFEIKSDYFQCRGKCDKEDFNCYEEPPTGKWADCTETQACADDGFTCYETTDGKSQCRTLCNKEEFDCYVAPSTGNYGDCTDTQLCRNSDWNCLKKDDSFFKCLKTCPNDHEWDCYVPPLPGKYADCTDAKACKHEAEGFSCFERDSTYSECRKKCDKKTWDCYEGAGKWAECTVSQKCADDGFTCFETTDGKSHCRDKCNKAEYACYVEPPQTCNHYIWDCPIHHKDVTKRFSVECAGNPCVESDHATCCVAKILGKWVSGCTFGANDNCDTDSGLMCMKMKEAPFSTQCRPWTGKCPWNRVCQE